MATRLQVDYSTDPAILQQWASSIGPSGWIMLESYTGLEFQEWKTGSPIPHESDIFAGRLFGPDAEIRWTCEAGVFELWRIRDGAEGETVVTAKHRFYYGWAWFEEKLEKGKLWDPRLHRTPAYPLPAAPLRDNDRARFRVVEYYAEAPDRAPVSIEEAEKWLNAPRFIAYRLQSFDFHQGEK